MLGTSDTISQRLERLAGDIEASSQSAADRLRDLGAAVDGGHYADIWAAHDMYQIVDPDTIADHVRSGKDDWVRVIELLRNALVFAPIAVTWLGIWHALESYSVAIESQPDLATLSFLYLWQKGFGGLSISLSTIALIDGALLSLVFVMTLIVLWYNNQKDIDAQDVRDELAGLLAESSLALGHRRMQQSLGTAQVFERMSQELLAELRQEHRRIQELLAQKDKDAETLIKATQSLSTSIQQLHGSVQSLQHMPQHMEKHFVSLATSLQQYSTQYTDLQKEFTRALYQAVNQVKEMNDSQQSLLNDMQTMGATMQAMGTNLSLLIQNLSSQQQDFVATAHQAGTQFKQLTDAQKTIGINLQTMLINMETMTVDLRATVGTLQTTTSETARASAEISSLLPALTQMQAQLIALLKREHAKTPDEHDNA